MEFVTGICDELGTGISWGLGSTIRHHNEDNIVNSASNINEAQGTSQWPVIIQFLVDRGCDTKRERGP